MAGLAKKLLRVERIVHVGRFGTFFIDPCSHLGSQLLTTDEYEPAVTDSVQQLVPRGGTFVDLGANEGFFSVVGAQAAGVDGKVLATEPQQRLIPLIEENVRLNAIHNVVVSPLAVSNLDGQGAIFLTPDFNTGSSGFTRLTKYPLRRQPVNTVTLETLLEQYGVEEVDLLKIDIEGHEYEAVMGAQSIFRRQRIKHIALELHEPILMKRGRKSEDIRLFIEACGYHRNGDFQNLVFSAH